MGSVGLHRGEPRVQCSTYRESGSCTNSRRVHRRKIEAAVLNGLREVLKQPDYLAVYLKAYNEERNRLARGAIKNRSKLESRTGEIKRDIERLIDSIVQGVPADTIAPRLQALETEKRTVAEQLAAADADKKVITIHPAAIKHYLTDVELMRAALEDDKAAERPELIEPRRRLIHSVVVHASPGVKGFEVEIKGRLHELIDRPLVGGGRMVAREGLEPPTPGL
jgi:site-specific DNA recombinase